MQAQQTNPMSLAKLYKQLSEASQTYATVAKDNDEFDRFNAELTLLRDRYCLHNGERIQPKQKVAFLALPRYGSVERETDQAAYTNASETMKVLCCDKPGSALPFGFNRCFCDFLNLPERPDYFGMLHSDVYPMSDRWVDILASEMDKHDLDVIHAVCAIKDICGLTSTMVGWDMHDQFPKYRRIVMKELVQLPETFVLSDIAKVWGEELPGWAYLGCNTGCMLCRVGDWVDRFPGFSFHDGIDRSSGCARPLFQPEDWEFARWCANEGLRVGGCHKFPTTHYGMAGYQTGHAWGTMESDKR